MLKTLSTVDGLSACICKETRPGVSTGSAMAQMSDLVSSLDEFDFQWSGLSWQP